MNIKYHTKSVKEYLFTLVRWLAFALMLGVVGGLFGVLFHYMVDEATHLRVNLPSVIFLLPISGILIVYLYKSLGLENDKGTNAIIQAVRLSEDISPKVTPAIIISTTLTHLCGGSSGREGAALQIGGSIGSFFAKLLKLKTNDKSTMIMCSMSALFSAVFGTPLTASIFCLEVASVGTLHYAALFPAVLSAVTAQGVAKIFNISPTRFNLLEIPDFDYLIVFKVIVLAVLTAVVSILFVYSMHKSSKLFGFIENRYLRILIGSIIVIALTFLVGTTDYNGAGMGVITTALENGKSAPFAFLLKIIFTAVTLSAGFKGGEIVPTFFIGSTFGVFVAPVLGLNPSFAASVALICLFCGVVNCPLASIILSIELFGASGILYFAIGVSVSYIISGYYSLYSTQKIVYSKLDSGLVNKDTH